MEKERLTFEIIQKDVMRQIRKSWHTTTILMSLLILCCILLPQFTDPSVPIELFQLLLFWALALLCTYIRVRTLVISIRQYRHVKSGRFRIVTDRVVGIEEKQIYGRHNTAAMFNKPYRLHFACYGTYHVSYGKTHEWSKKFCLSDDGVYRYAHIDDEFYLVTTDGKTILEAYNKRLFELAEEQ